MTIITPAVPRRDKVRMTIRRRQRESRIVENGGWQKKTRKNREFRENRERPYWLAVIKTRRV